MKESEWEDCIASGNARSVSPDKERAKSLIETSKERTSLIGEVNEKNCNFVFEDYYTSLMELLQAMCFSRGFNVLNHICLEFYLRDTVKRRDLFEMFDDVRFKRNSLAYYGKRMDFEVACEAIEKCKKLIKELEKLLSKA